MPGGDRIEDEIEAARRFLHRLFVFCDEKFGAAIFVRPFPSTARCSRRYFRPHRGGDFHANVAKPAKSRNSDLLARTSPDALEANMS